VRKRSRLRLVVKGEGDATRIFDDLDKLRADVGARPSSSPAPESPLRSRRVREAETFARMPHDRALDHGAVINAFMWTSIGPTWSGRQLTGLGALVGATATLFYCVLKGAEQIEPAVDAQRARGLQEQGPEPKSGPAACFAIR
jgi:hypothetical protein